MTQLATSSAAATIGALTFSVEPIDAVVQSHLSQRYWDWRRLYDAAGDASPMSSPDYVLGEVRHVPPTRLQPVLVTAHQDERCVGIGALLPKLVRSNRLGSIGLDVQWSGLRLAGNEWLAAAEVGPRDGYPWASKVVVNGLTTAALEHVQDVGARFLLAEDVDVESPLDKALSASAKSWLQFRHTGLQPRRRILLPSTKDEYWGRFSKKTLSTLRRKLKKFGHTRLERITEVSQVARFLEIAHEISRQTWQTRQFGLRVRNDDAELDLFATLADHGLLRSYLWFSHEQPVAFLIGNQDKGTFHYEEVGYATPFAKHSPGLVMLVQVLDDLMEHHRPERFDFGGGDADYKQFFSNHESRSGTVWLFSPNCRNRAALAYLQLCATARRWARHAVAVTGWANRARQWIRYRGSKTTVSPSDSADN